MCNLTPCKRPLKDFDQWNGSNGDEARLIWGRIGDRLSETAGMVAGLIERAKNQPDKFKALLSANQVEILGSDKCSISERLVLTLGIHVLGYSQRVADAAMYPIAASATKGVIEAGTAKAKSLCWSMHIHLYCLADRYPSIRHAIRLRQGGIFEGETPADFMPPAPHLIPTGAFCKLPFKDLQTLLRVFGTTRRGRYVDLLQETYHQRRESTKQTQAMDWLEGHFSIKLERFGSEDHRQQWADGEYDVTREEAIVCADEVFGLNETFWHLNSFIGVAEYINNKDALDTAFRELGKEQLNKQKVVDMRLGEGYKYKSAIEKGQQDRPSDDGNDDSDSDWDDDDDDAPQEIPFPIQWGHASNIFAHATVGRGRRKRKRYHFDDNPQRYVSYQAAKLAVGKYNKDGRPVDLQLPEGLAIWEHFSEEMGSPDNYSMKGQVGARDSRMKLVTLGTGDATYVVNVEQAFSDQFIRIMHKMTNKTPHCHDPNSDGGTSCIGAYFSCVGCQGEQTEMCPLMKLGKNSIAAVPPAHEFQRKKHLLASAFTNIFIDTYHRCRDAIFACQSDNNDGSSTNSNDSESDSEEEQSSTHSGVAANATSRSMHMATEDNQTTEDETTQDRDTQDDSNEDLSSGSGEETVQISLDANNPPEATNRSTDWRDWCGGFYPVNRELVTDDDINKWAKSREAMHLKFRRHQLPNLPRQFVNCDISKCGKKSKYGGHRDWSGVLGSTLIGNVHARVCLGRGGSNDTSKTEVPMPTPDQLAVTTFVTGWNCGSRVSWKKDGETLAEIVTGENTIHFQSSGNQSGGIQHESETIGSKMTVFTTSMRGVDTYRQVLCPRCDAKPYRNGIERDDLGWNSQKRASAYCDYSRLDAMKVQRDRETRKNIPPYKITDGVEAPVEDDDTIRPAKRTKLVREEFKRLNRDEYRTCISRREMDPFGKAVRKIRRPQTMISLRDTRAECVKHRTMVNAFLRRGLFPSIVDRDQNPVEDQPVFMLEEGKLLVPGDVVPQDRLPLSRGQRDNDVVNEKHPGLICVMYAYKNHPESFDIWTEYAHGVADARAGEKPEWDLNTDEGIEKMKSSYEALGNLEIHGFGGSQEYSGKNAITVGNSPLDVAYRTGHSQSTKNSNNMLMHSNFEGSRVMAVFVCEATWGKKMGQGEKKRKRDADVALFLGYAYIQELCTRKIDWNEMTEMYSSMPYYYQNNESNKGNMTHKLEDFKVFRMKQLMDWDTFLASVKAGKGSELGSVKIYNEDSNPIAAPVEKMAAQGLVMDGAPDHNQDDFEYKRLVPYISSDLVRKYFCGGDMPAEEFKRIMETENMDDNDTKLPPKSFRKIVSTVQAAMLQFMVMGAAAMRFFREISVDGDKPTPLTKFPSDCLSDSHRTSPLPCSNPDADVNVQFAGCQMRKLVRWVCELGAGEKLPDCMGGVTMPDGYVKPKPLKISRKDDTTPLSYVALDLTSDVNREIVVQCLFMALVCRFTGRTSALRQFDSSILPLDQSSGQNCHLPLTGDCRHFLSFVEDWCWNQLSISALTVLQFLASIPTELSSGSKQHFVDFLENICLHSQGIAQLRDVLATNDTGGMRESLHARLCQMIRICGDARGGRIGFIASKIISDVEAVFPGVFGRVTIESVVLGFGGTNGIDCIALPSDAGDKLRRRDERFVNFHQWMQTFFMGAKEEIRRGSGWKLSNEGDNGNVLVSVFTGREFSLADTEHILCKIWLTLVHSHASRNLTFEKEASSYFCYPLFCEGEWEEDIKPEMEDIVYSVVEWYCGSNASDGGYHPQALFSHEKTKGGNRVCPGWFGSGNVDVALAHLRKMLGSGPIVEEAEQPDLGTDLEAARQELQGRNEVFTKATRQDHTRDDSE